MKHWRPWRNRKEAQLAIGKVVQFVRANPLSTAKEIYDAVGVSPSAARKYVKPKKYNGQTVYRLNHEALGTALGSDDRSA